MNSLTGIERLPEFDDHQLVSFVFDEPSHLRGFVAIHRSGADGAPALGATRLWDYDDEISALRDALRLSRMMSYKSVMAGLPYGGAKAALIKTPAVDDNRDVLFRSYAKKLNDLDGRFITGTDVGVTDDDVKNMSEFTDHVIGSQLDPAYYTAIGVLGGIKEALFYLFGDDSVSKRSFAVQGLGKTGCGLIKLIHNEADVIYGADIEEGQIKKVLKQFPKIKIVSPSEIHRQRVDVFVPAALSGALNSKSVSELKCQIVAGSANNQLADEYVDELLNRLGILYAPDYVINAGGLISVVDEFEHTKPSEKRILQRIGDIRKTLRTIFDQSAKEQRATNAVADEMAERIFNNHT